MIDCASASVADVDSIMPLMAKAFLPDYGESWSAAQCMSMLSLPNCHFMIGRRLEKVVGFAIWRVVLDEAELLLFAVDPGCHGTGLGSTLLDHVATESAIVGAKKLHVEVRSDNHARAFYSRRGFTEVGVRQNYYRRKDGGPTEAISLVRLLCS
jgi:[ribosomal protein S18]-alanine N-acetyltransferase